MNPEFSEQMTVALVNYMADDQTVIDAARVSTNTVDADTDTQRFINFLMRDRHGSPFEHCVMTFALDVPIFVAREIMRHRIASYSEESGRYTESRLKFYTPHPERPLVQVGKPGAYTFEPGFDYQKNLSEVAPAVHARNAAAYYQDLLEAGVAREVARIVLPLSMYTRIRMTINARSLMNFLSLRNATSDTTVPTFPLWEIQEVAKQMESLFQDLMPATHTAFIQNGRVAP